MKKPVLLAIVVTALSLTLAVLCLHSSAIAPSSPRLVPAKDVFVPADHDRMSYDFLSPSPFEGGKVWISLRSKNGFHVGLFDVDHQVMIGELLNANHVFLSHDQTRLLCVQRTRATTNTLVRLYLALVQSAVSRGHESHYGQDQETYWVLDLKQNSATRLGHAFQSPGAGTSFEPSPDFRYGFNKPSGSFNVSELFICDLDHKSLRNEPVSGDPVGWWDEHRILMKATNNDLVLFDVEARNTSPFLSQSQLTNFYAAAGLTNNPAKANPISMWNGRENEFYLSDANKRWSAAESFLARIGRPNGALTLLDPHFKFEWSDHFDAGGKSYLYSGRDSGKTNSAVYLRDLQTGQTRELVPPDPNHTNTFSTPQFYRGTVIYMRSNALWQIDLDGRHNRRLFPPPQPGP